jgi:hypothetical protein
MPNVQNVPLFKEKNEYRISAGAQNSEDITSLEIQAAYSVSNHIALTANYMSAEGKDNSATKYGKGNYIDAAIGYYKPFRKYGVFELYGGFGNSSQHHQYETYGSSDLSFMKLFLQPSIGYTYKTFDIALSTRISNISFYQVENKSVQAFYLYDLNMVDKNRDSYLLEPAITIRFGWKYVKLQTQFQILKNLSHDNMPFQEPIFAGGLYIAIAKRYKPITPR